MTPKEEAIAHALRGAVVAAITLAELSQDDTTVDALLRVVQRLIERSKGSE